MRINNFGQFLEKLGYSSEQIAGHLEEDTFSYPIEISAPDIEDAPVTRLPLRYAYTPSEDAIYKHHSIYWNLNDANVFIAVSDDNCHIINAREKPDEREPLNKRNLIRTFNYGINSKGFEKEKLETISREAVDSNYFFDFVIREQKEPHEVDKDLLLNLIALRKDLVKGGDERIVHLLILRCLFIKYLEDRQIYDDDYLLNILRTGSPEKLIHAFDETRKINGDIFKLDRLEPGDLKTRYLEKLYLFFSSDYRSGQGRLFPYRFDKIPVQLVSNVYEAFLNSKKKKGGGIYYTPAFLVNFMLSHTLREKLNANPRVTILDPACGSGAFLVESFKMLIDAQPEKPGFEAKKDILQNCLFGIDNDPGALQIAAFSLYLVLLETEDPKDIRRQIERAHPILPGLIGKNLIHGNTITDDSIFAERTFDCIVANPPWGPAPDDGNPEHVSERTAIGTKDKPGTNPEYKNVSDSERSQAFLLRARGWSWPDTVFSLVVKNSIFLNEKSGAFRKELLEKYCLSHFYELSNLNKILFKKRSIGEIDGLKIEIGATEPCAVLVFKNAGTGHDSFNYISPKLTGFSEKFQVIHFGPRDVTPVNPSDIIEDDSLWIILAKGNLDDYNLIRKVTMGTESLKEAVCSRGFEAKENMKPTKPDPWYRTLIRSQDFDRYFVKNELGTFNWHQELPRPREESLYTGKRVLIAYRPKPKDGLRLRCIFTKKDMVFRNDTLCFKSPQIQDYLPYLAILNSSFAGYYLYKVSAQWYGGLKREALRTYDLKSMPFPAVEESDPRVRELTRLVQEISPARGRNEDTSELERKIDELVFDLYRLLDFEKEIIREFYQVNVERKKHPVKVEDLQNYLDRFRENFALVLDKKYRVNARYRISPHIGAALCIQLVEKDAYIPEVVRDNVSLLDIVKQQQLGQSFTSRMLNEDKVKIYEKDRFYIVKSRYFKDWTPWQAIKDANEEIGLLFKHLPERRAVG